MTKAQGHRNVRHAGSYKANFDKLAAKKARRKVDRAKRIAAQKLLSAKESPSDKRRRLLRIGTGFCIGVRVGESRMIAQRDAALKELAVLRAMYQWTKETLGK